MASPLIARRPDEGDSILKNAFEDIEAAAAYAQGKITEARKDDPTSCKGANADSTGAKGDATSFLGSGAPRKGSMSATVQVARLAGRGQAFRPQRQPGAAGRAWQAR